MIAIDNAEFVDEDSWSFMSVLLELDVMFIVMTMGTHVELSSTAVSALNHRRVRILNLAPIDKWYQAGLACQILDVQAIPPELEK